MVATRTGMIVSAALSSLLILTGCGSTAGSPTVTPGTSAASTVAPSPVDGPEATRAATLVPPSTPFSIEVETTAKGRDGIRVTGTTNLPDGSILGVTASRALRNEGETDVRESPAGDGEVTVKDGAFALSLTLDETTLPIGVDEQFPIAVVSPLVDVCVTFATGVDNEGVPHQTDAGVLEAVGPNGERLVNSDQAQVFGSLTDHPAHWLEVPTSVRQRVQVLDQIVSQQGFEPDVEPLEGFCL
jgi:hypothetical protein